MSSTLSLLQYNHNIITNDTAETLSNALDIDLSNISETGKNAIASISLPSETYTTLTVGSSGTSYTAPADGWVYFYKVTGSSSATYINIGTSYYSVENRSYGSSTAGLSSILPINSGQKFTVSYSATGTSKLIFIYAVGAESVAE